jgi:DNA ligase-associated metallophosphoesterase
MEITLAEERLEMLPERALWWPSQRALLIADVHLGKDQVFRRRGLAVPAGVLDDALGELDALLKLRPAERLIILGDLVHAAPEPGESWPERVAGWRRRHAEVDMAVVLGNHDRALAPWLDAWDMRSLEARTRLGALTLVHEADTGAPRPGVSGHLHPVTRLRSGREHLRLPVFARYREHLILPAFGRFVGGFDMQALPGWRLYAAAGRQVLALR